MIRLAADFETSVEADVEYHINHGDKEHSRVYLWCVHELFNDKDTYEYIKIGDEDTIKVVDKIYEYGYNIESFFKFLEELNDNCEMYFHNLKFDGQFIKWYLDKHNFKFISKYDILEKNFPDELEYNLNDVKYRKCLNDYQKMRKPYRYEYLITNMGVWHEITIYFKSHRVKIYDSVKLFNAPLDSVLKAHNTEEKIKVKKTRLDVSKQRAPNYNVGDEELIRCANDTIGLAYVLGLHKLDQEDEGFLSSNTIGSCAIKRYIKSLEEKHGHNAYRNLFPTLEDNVDQIVRHSYRGGWSYVNPIHANKLLHDVDVYDCNSMYPSVMASCKMPYGPVIFNKSYDADNFTLKQMYEDIGESPDNVFFIIVMECGFIVKKDGLPFINDTRKLSSASIYADIDILALPEPLFDLFRENYIFKIYGDSEIQVIAWKAKKGLFNEYIQSVYDKKQYYATHGNNVLKNTYKLFMNSLYGKFGQRRRTYQKVERDGATITTEKAIIKHDRYSKDYTPIATAITGYAKQILTRLARSFGDRFVYTDTDSIHVLKGDLCDLKQVVDINNTGELGLWKKEHEYKKAKYLHSKCYLALENGKIVTTIAGLKKQKSPQTIDNVPLDFANFVVGTEIKGNLKPVKVPGGVYLKRHPFKLRPTYSYSNLEEILDVIDTAEFDDPYYKSKEFLDKATYSG